jgi:adenosine deaminase CECR1
MYRLALEYPNIHIRVPTAITSSSSLPIPTFKALSPEKTAQYASEPPLTSPDYKPGYWAPLKKARDEFRLGGPEAFDQWVVGSMTIHPKEAYAEFNTSAKVGSGHLVLGGRTLTACIIDLEKVSIDF